jgi:hypothetical protein
MYFACISGAEEDLAWPSRMTTLPEWRDGGGYGTECAEEQPSKEPLLEDNLAGCVGIEQDRPCAGGVARYSGR